jgi:nitroreductase
MAVKTDDVVSKLQWRYATKKFDADRKIDQATWKKIEESLILTPSSFGLQPWKFVVVTDPAIKEQLVEHSWAQRQPVECSHLVVISRLSEMTKEYAEDYVQYMADVRGLDVSALDPFKGMLLGFLKGCSNEKAQSWMEHQCYIALGNLMTAASMFDVDNCPMEGFDKAAYDRILKLPEKGCNSVVVCALGYRAADDKYAQLRKVRFARERVIVEI